MTGVTISPVSIGAFLVGIIVLYVFGRVLLVPTKWIIRLFWNAVLGFIGLYLLNYFGGALGVHIAINFVNALIAGILGIPGVGLLLILQQM